MVFGLPQCPPELVHIQSPAVLFIQIVVDLHRVELTVYADNEAAIGLYRKFGFEAEGLFRDYAVRDGQWV